MQITPNPSQISTRLQNHYQAQVVKPYHSALNPLSPQRRDTVSFGARPKADKPVSPDIPTREEARRLLQEIGEQPAVLKKLIRAFPHNFDGLTLPAPTVTELKGVAEGSSLNALSIAAPYIKAFAGVPLKPVSPEVLENELEIARRYNPTRSDQANKQFFLTVSQSFSRRWDFLSLPYPLCLLPTTPKAPWPSATVITFR
jgi:hypothetical protein